MKNKQAKINYTDLWGLREEKYKFLEENDVNNTTWQELQPTIPYYFLVPKNFRSEYTYNKFFALEDIFERYQIGLMTGQDDFFVDSDRGSLSRRIQMVLDNKISNTDLNLFYKLTSQAGKKLLKNRKNLNFDESLFMRYNYRPFDTRYIYAENKFLWRSVEDLRINFLKLNLAIVTTRILSALPFRHAFISENIGDNTFISNFTKERNYFFPLYLYYEEEKQQAIFTGQEKLDLEGTQHTLRHKSDKEPNIDPKLFNVLKNTFSIKLNPEQIFYYIYSILYSNIYRQKYQEFLKIDFPKIPFTKDYDLFKNLAELGKQLVNLHLLKTKELENPSIKYPMSGDNKVEKREYNEGKKRVCINNSQYFAGIDSELWNYYVGGYQVLEKWLKDRKGRTLSAEDIKHYCKVATALAKTITIQKQIDELYPEVEKKLA